jgi:small subunit ribosomal protein S7
MVKNLLLKKITYGALDAVAESKGGNGLEIFQKAIENISPLVEGKSRRVGGATYQVPV